MVDGALIINWAKLPHLASTMASCITKSKYRLTGRNFWDEPVKEPVAAKSDPCRSRCYNREYLKFSKKLWCWEVEKVITS
jgi:hypothetical protein